VHGGDPPTVATLVRLAARRGVAIGAHPGLPDRASDGRREVAITPGDVHALVLYQIGAVDAFVRADGLRLRHVKPHGALYNMAAKDRALADAIAGAVARFDPAIVLVGLSGSELIHAAADAGLRSASEVFADRSYESDGTLTPRAEPGALIDDEAAVVAQVRRMIGDGRVRSRDGHDVLVQADSVCVHGDGPHALLFARRVRESLAADGVAFRALA